MLVVLEGQKCSGKTTLTKELARLTGGTYLKLQQQDPQYAWEYFDTILSGIESKSKSVIDQYAKSPNLNRTLEWVTFMDRGPMSEYVMRLMESGESPGTIAIDTHVRMMKMPLTTIVLSAGIHTIAERYMQRDGEAPGTSRISFENSLWYGALTAFPGTELEINANRQDQNRIIGKVLRDIKNKIDAAAVLERIK